MLSLLAATPQLADISSLLRRALLSESEQAETGVLPPNLLLDYSLLHREIEDSTGRPRTAAIRCNTAQFADASLSLQAARCATGSARRTA